MCVESIKALVRSKRVCNLAICTGVLILLGAMPASTSDSSANSQLFSFFTDSQTFGRLDQVGLVLSLAIAIGSIICAWFLSKRVYAADAGTFRMQEIAQAVRDGSDAYLSRQFKVVGLLLVVLTLFITLSKWPWNAGPDVSMAEIQTQEYLAVARGVAFFVGAIFSASVGFFGMRLATTGNLRVAAAAKRSFTEAMKLAYQTGTVTGLLTTGLGLLGGCVIVLVVGIKAYETLLGFAFGGSLLALFMRVGGGIYTKAADVGADLVGKIEANIPEDDPRNAATIADNVGDNVGDCAGMAADVFESYTVTMVAAMILGYAAFGPKAMLLPLFIQAVGIVSSLFSTFRVGRGRQTGGAEGAMRTINQSFRVGALLSLLGFVVIGAVFLRFDRTYIITQAVTRGLYKVPEFAGAVHVDTSEWKQSSYDLEKRIRSQEQKLDRLRDGDYSTVSGTAADPRSVEALKTKLKQEQELRLQQVLSAWKNLPPDEQAKVADISIARSSEDQPSDRPITVFSEAQRLVPLHIGWDLRPIACCLVGVLLTLALMYCTEYWTSTAHSPVQSLTKSSRTGHATNIIQGIAIGYESTVWAVILIAAAILAGVYIFNDTHSPLFIAYGVSLAGMGMLALTADTLSMDVFGPVADNANGIGEMGYNRDAMNRPLTPADADYMPPEQYESARQILTDLDATGNTTKAITKGIAIGSAVIAAVSLFASFIAVLVTGSEEKINELTSTEFHEKAGQLSVANPFVFIGLLIGGAVPFLFSSMTIRAVGRAAYLIVNECRRQFKDKAIWDGTKKPDYGRVVHICTSTAQKELIGPGLLAIFTPIVVGFLLGPYALGGFLAGMIVVGQLLAVFMATAGGAWDNAKKMIEDQPRTSKSGKGSEVHKASITGDTVGDPLKDTAGPAINPLIKVMNMVSLLILPIVILYNLRDGNSFLGYAIVALGLAAIGWSWWQSKHDTEEMRILDAEYDNELREAIVEANLQKQQAVTTSGRHE